MSANVPNAAGKLVIYGANINRCNDKYATILALDAVRVAKLTALYDTFKTLFDKSKATDHTHTDIVAKNDAKDAYDKDLRKFIHELQANPAMTDPIRAEYDITIADKTKTPHPRPAGIPIIQIVLAAFRIVTIKFYASPTAKRPGKPSLVTGFECCYALLDKEPVDIEELIHFEWTASSPLRLTFKESERGKRLYFAVRRPAGSDNKGDWSEIFMVIVP
jgi:hypothetical protein